jgi:capsular polysaccharide biosynthesis protein
MNIIYYFNLFKRWIWLLALGLFFGLIGGYLASYYQEPVYKASTKLMITRQVQNENPDFAGLNSQQLVQTYVEILKTKPLLGTTSERVGVDIASEQISVQQLLDTQIIEIKVENHDPVKAADYANTMVLILIEQNEDMQAGQYSVSENRLVEQIDQVKVQIDALQTEYDQTSNKDFQDQLTLVEEQINAIQTELSTLQFEIESLNPGYREADRVLMAEKQIRVQQLQTMFENYERIRANLLVFKRPIDTDQIQDDPYIQQLQSTINLYQDLYLTLVEELEKVRLARLQETPNVIQIEQATIPEKPVRPIPILYTAVSGVVGIMLAVLLVFLIETLRNEQEAPDIDLLPNSEKGTRGTEKVSSERSIADLELGKRATDALAKAGIIKVGQFITKLAEGEDVLLAVSGFSQISLIDAKKKLRALGYKIPRQ